MQGESKKGCWGDAYILYRREEKTVINQLILEDFNIHSSDCEIQRTIRSQADLPCMCTPLRDPKLDYSAKLITRHSESLVKKPAL